MACTVEFEGIQPFYTDEKPIQISYRSLNTTSQVNSVDWIYLLLEETTTIDQALLSVKVGRPSGHWSVDNGRYKLRGVMLDFSKAKLPPLNETGEAVCCLWLVRRSVTGDDQVLTKTESFKVQFKEGVDYTLKSLVDDYTMVTVNKSVQGFSLTSQVESLDQSSLHQSDSADQPSSSFIIVDDVNSNILSAPEDIDIENDRDPSLSESAGEYVVPIVSREGASEDTHPPVPLESDPWSQKTNTSDPERPIPKCRSKIKDKATNTDLETTIETNEAGVQVDSPEHSSPVVNQYPNRIADTPFELLNLPETNTLSVDMSASVNLGTTLVSQKEGKILKNINKEQRLKINKLTSHMEKMKQEIIVLREDRKDVDPHIIHELENQLQQLLDEKENIVCRAAKEKKVMDKKVSQLKLDYTTLFERCTILLSQQQEQETENTILRSENLVLNEKVKGLEEKVKKQQQESQPREKVEKPKRSFHVPQVLSTAKNLADATPAVTKPVRIQPLSTTEKIPQRKRPSDLPLDVPAKTKPVPVPLDVLAKTKPVPVPLDVLAKTKPVPVPLDVLAKTKPVPVPLDVPANTKPAPMPVDVYDRIKPSPVPRKSNPHKSRSTRRSTDAGPQVNEATYSKRPHHDFRKHAEHVSKVKSTWNGSREAKLADVRTFSSQNSTSKAGEILSENRIEEITSQLRGTPVVICPVCQKVLHARDGDFAVRLHVEHCLRDTIYRLS